MKTENNTKAIKAALAYKSAVENASARLWEFGREVHELTENAPHGAARRLAVALAHKTGKKSSTWEVEISRAKRCYATYEKASDAAYFTLDEVSGRETAEKSRFSAKKKAESIAKGLTKAQVASLISELKKFA